MAVPNPPLDLFLAALNEERTWGQVLVRRTRTGFELRHAADRGAPTDRLRPLGLADLRGLAQATASGVYRPLRSAPDLATGWRCEIHRPTDLAAALHHLYPGSLADAWALETRRATATSFPEFVGNLEGRAQVLATLTGAALAAAVEAGCSPAGCLKHRHWTAPGLPPDDDALKSALPCLEPCPLFLAFARACAETEQTATVPVEFAPDDLATLAAALRHALEHPPAGGGTGDVGSPLHPWRLRRVLARNRGRWPSSGGHAPDPDEAT